MSSHQEKPFEISFKFPLEKSKENIRVKARAQLHHSKPYYRVDNFFLEDGKMENHSFSLLPPIEIECIEQEGKMLWVDKDTKRASLLSLAIGESIDRLS